MEMLESKPFLLKVCSTAFSRFKVKENSNGSLLLNKDFLYVVFRSHAPEKSQLVGRNHSGNNKSTLKTHLVNLFSPCEFTLNGNAKK